MSRTSHICFYSCERPTNPRKLLYELLLKLEPQKKYITVSRESEKSLGWENFQRQKNGEGIEFFDISSEISRKKCSISETVELFVDDDKGLLVDLSGSDCELHIVVQNTVLSLEPNIRKTFDVSELYLTFGWHDVFEFVDHEEGHLFGRAFFSINFWGWRYPNIPLFREVIFGLTEMKQVKTNLESISGVLEQCFYID